MPKKNMGALTPQQLLLQARNRRYYETHERSVRRDKPFMGVDGEGGGTDEYGRQNFLLFRAGNRELFNDNNPLRTLDLLNFICSLPSDVILVGYYFTYDVTQILRDLSVERLQHLYSTKERGEGFSSYTYYGDFAIEFIPRQYFRVARLRDRNNDMRVIPNSARTINEVGGFFQKSFVEALGDWNIGTPKLRAEIYELKQDRENFTTMTQRERNYCARECSMLAEMMESVREAASAAGIKPRHWRGAGSLAARLHELHNTPKHPTYSKRLEIMAHNAYYGGRFEITTIGRVKNPVWEYDINSAYPDAIRQLPCPIHTKWKAFTNEPPKSCSYFIADIRFRHPSKLSICCFPVRRKGKLFWPVQGNGVYWSPEIQVALSAKVNIKINKGYAAVSACSCDYYTWVNELYEYRKSIGKAAKGIIIKLGSNALYGKYAQRVGARVWRDVVVAGLITAICRAKLLSAAMQAPDNILMMATDGIYSTTPLDLDTGNGLGQWEVKERPTGMFIVQPGIYWSPGSDERTKTRGIPRSKIIAQRDQFETLWNAWCRGDGSNIPPSVAVPLTNFIGHRLALARGKPQTAGQWQRVVKHIDFDWQGKRQPVGQPVDGTMHTLPIAGSRDLVSDSYDPAMLRDLEMQLLELEASPDFEPWGNSGE